MSLLRRALTRGLATAASPRLGASPTQLLKSLEALRLQPQHYAKVQVDGKAYTLTKGDLLHLPTRLKQTQIGDTLRLTHATMIGSRDFTIRGKHYVRDNLFECLVTVVEHTKQPMLRTIKRKRRNRHVKQIESKQPYTVLRVSELKVASQSTSIQEDEAGNAVV